MVVNSAPLPWFEAHDQPCKGSTENRKSATASQLPDCFPQKSQDRNTLTPRNTHVILFHRNRPEHNLPIFHTQKNTVSIIAYGKKTPVKSNQREARANATQGWLVATYRTSSRRRKAEGQAPNLCRRRHLKSLTGQTTYATKKKIRTYHKSPFKIPHLPITPRPSLRRMHVCISPRYDHTERPH